MKFSSSAVLLAAALGASAHPSGHAHQRAHAKRDFIVANNPVTVYETHVVTAAAAPATAVPEVPAPAQPKVEESAVPKSWAASGPSTPDVPKLNKGKKHSSGSGFKPFCGGKKAKRATLEDIASTGNVGVAGNYGCNIMTVDSDVADKYTYTTTFKNDHDEEKQCSCWNKIGPTGGIDGFFAKNIPVHFSVPAKSSQVVAFDENSQGGCACASKEVPTTSNGLVAGTWLEFDFGSERNSNWSGADASCLVSAKENLDIPGLRVCGHGTCSTIFPGGTGENAYLGGMEAEDGIGLNLNTKEVRLTVDIDYKG